jgi:hypothetical protein
MRTLIYIGVVVATLLGLLVWSLVTISEKEDREEPE